MRARTSSIVLGSAFGVLATLASGCFSEANECTATNTCAAAVTMSMTDADAGDADANGEAAVGEGGIGIGDDGASSSCSGSAHPSDDPCVIDEHFAVFVAPDAAANGTGARGHELSSIAAAIKAAKSAKKRVYVCADRGAFDESLALDASVDGVALYGGFACGDWSYDVTRHAVLAPTKPGPVVSAQNLAVGVTLDGFVVHALDATTAGSSSVAMIVNASVGVVLRRVTLDAGNGASGATGTNGATGAVGAAPTSSQHGAASTCTSAPAFEAGGAWSTPSSCGSIGGLGGEALLASAGSSGQRGMPTVNVDPAGNENAGSGASTVRAAGQPGGAGSTGLIGSPGVVAPTLGTFSASGFAPANGGDGVVGHAGQGGGGGGASSAIALPACIGASGGAGGMGGCGGGAGTGGKGGGASVALLVWSSSVSLVDVTLIAKSGGAGGNGGNAGYGGGGGAGGQGGAPLGGAVGAGGSGGEGGNGGDGGAGAGGNGGPSYALVHSGTPPTISGATTFTQGAGGARGIGGALPPQTANKAPDGNDGVAAPVLAM